MPMLIPIPIPMPVASPERPVVPVDPVADRPTKPASWFRPTNPPRSIGSNSPSAAPVDPEFRLEDAVVRDELTGLLEVADVLVDCA